MKRLVLILCLLATPVFAVQPDEMLDDPVLEERARELVQGPALSGVPQRKHRRKQRRSGARPAACWCANGWWRGIATTQAIDFIVDRYGEYVLLKPTASGSNLALWIAGPVMLLVALGIAGLYLRRRSTPATGDDLSAEEQARLKEIMSE